MKNTDEKVINNSTYQFGVNNSNEDLDIEKILDELEALDKLRSLSPDVCKIADKEKWGLEKIIKALEQVESNQEKENEIYNERDSIWSISLFGNIPIRKEKKEDK